MGHFFSRERLLRVCLMNKPLFENHRESFCQLFFSPRKGNAFPNHLETVRRRRQAAPESGSLSVFVLIVLILIPILILIFLIPIPANLFPIPAEDDDDLCSVASLLLCRVSSSASFLPRPTPKNEQTPARLAAEDCLAGRLTLARVWPFKSCS